MTLIESPRVTDRDRAAWERLSRYDERLARTVAMTDLEAAAVAEIERFASTARDPVVSTSWGKDSTVVAHLATLADTPGLRFAAVRVRHWEAPETDLVRDAFLTAHPEIVYDEVVYDDPNPKRGEPGFEEWFLDPAHQHHNILGRIGGSPIHGVRAQESKMRAASLRWHGTSTDRVCRPIIRWSGPEVFAYLCRESLPVHPTYAMSYGGVLDRQWLRVGILGSEPPTGVKRDVAQWEDDYYGDVLTAARRARRA